MKKTQTEVILKKFNDELAVEEDARAGAENSLVLLRKKIEEKKKQIEMIRNPKNYRNDEPKNFLASEKLASSKKQESLSPAKSRPKSVISPVKKKKARSISRNKG